MDQARDHSRLKYRKIARTIQHDRAKAYITNVLRSGTLGSEGLSDEGHRLLDMMENSDFEREILDIKGDFLTAYGEAFSIDTFPKTADITDAPYGFKAIINGVEVNPDIRFAGQRVTRTNRLRTGLGTIRCAKNKPLDDEVGAYQSSVLFGCRKLMNVHDDATPEEKLCLTLDCATGKFISAPTDAT